MTFRFYKAPVVVRDVWAGPKDNEHMPFPGHRTQQEVREDEERRDQHCNTRKKIRQA